MCGGPLPYEKITTLADLTKEMLIKRCPKTENVDWIIVVFQRRDGKRTTDIGTEPGKKRVKFFLRKSLFAVSGSFNGANPIFFFGGGAGDQKLMLKCCFQPNFEGFPYDLRIQFGFLSYTY